MCGEKKKNKSIIVTKELEISEVEKYRISAAME